VQSDTLGLDIPLAWLENGPKITLPQAVQLFNSRGSITSIQKLGRDVEADRVKADKAVVTALETVAKWVAKLLPPASPTPRPAPPSPTPEVEALPARRPARDSTKRRQAQVDVDDLVQAQILGEIDTIQSIEPALGRGKRVKISKK
jgi:hypothetical protein